MLIWDCSVLSPSLHHGLVWLICLKLHSSTLQGQLSVENWYITSVCTNWNYLGMWSTCVCTEAIWECGVLVHHQCLYWGYLGVWSTGTSPLFVLTEAIWPIFICVPFTFTQSVNAVHYKDTNASIQWCLLSSVDHGISFMLTDHGISFMLTDHGISFMLTMEFLLCEHFFERRSLFLFFPAVHNQFRSRVGMRMIQGNQSWHA